MTQSANNTELNKFQREMLTMLHKSWSTRGKQEKYLWGMVCALIGNSIKQVIDGHYSLSQLESILVSNRPSGSGDRAPASCAYFDVALKQVRDIMANRNPFNITSLDEISRACEELGVKITVVNREKITIHNATKWAVDKVIDIANECGNAEYSIENGVFVVSLIEINPPR